MSSLLSHDPVYSTQSSYGSTSIERHKIVQKNDSVFFSSVHIMPMTIGQGRLC